MNGFSKDENYGVQMLHVQDKAGGIEQRWKLWGKLR